MSLEIITSPEVDIKSDILEELLTNVEEAGQVVLHFIFKGNPFGSKIRIWPTTYLYDAQSDHRSEMIHVENITIYPRWQDILPFQDSYFTLIFSGLPRTCSTFHFIEHCDNVGSPFEVSNIARNESDVYYISMG